MATLRICSIPDCSKPAKGRGWCGMHYERWKTHGSPLLGGWPKRHCTVEGCTRKHIAKGLCRAHGKRLKLYGDPLGGGTFQGEPDEYFRSTVLAHNADECLIWPYARTLGGYGHLLQDGRHQYVHRLVCEYFEGPSPGPEYEASHSCHKGSLGCVAHRHIRWLTQEANLAERDENRRAITAGLQPPPQHSERPE